MNGKGERRNAVFGVVGGEMRGRISKIDDVAERRLTILLESGEALTYSLAQNEEYAVGDVVSIEYTPNGFEIRKLPSKKR